MKTFPDCDITAYELAIYRYLKQNLSSEELPNGFKTIEQAIKIPKAREKMAAMRRKGLIDYSIKKKTLIVKLKEIA